MFSRLRYWAIACAISGNLGHSNTAAKIPIRAISGKPSVAIESTCPGATLHQMSEKALPPQHGATALAWPNHAQQHPHRGVSGRALLTRISSSPYCALTSANIRVTSSQADVGLHDEPIRTALSDLFQSVFGSRFVSIVMDAHPDAMLGELQR
jgi:hypothetical protein